MEDIKLEEWQKVTIEALGAQRARLAKTIATINDAMKHYAENWANGEEGPFEFSLQPNGLYLVTKDETELAPAT